MSQTASDGTRILAVDDEPEQCEFWQLYLRSHGYDVEHACDGEEGLEMLVAFRPALVLTDIHMPRCDGLEFLRRAQELDVALPPVIAVSAYGWMETLALSAGASMFLRKPVSDLKMLLVVIHRLLARDATRSA